MTTTSQTKVCLGAALWLIATLPSGCEPPDIPGAVGGSAGSAGAGASGGGSGGGAAGKASGSGGDAPVAGEGNAGDGSAQAGEGGALSGEGGSASGEAGSPGGIAGTGGVPADGGDPVLGCAAGEWPSSARLELLPRPAFDPFDGPERVRKVSANGEVVIGDYQFWANDAWDLDKSRPFYWDGAALKWVDERAFGFATTVNCDGTVIAGRQAYLDAFIKTSGFELVIVSGNEPSWAAIPSDTSADGTAIAGNFRNIEPQVDRGYTDPVVWTNAGLPTFLMPLARRSARHIRYDGLLLAGDKNVCTGGMYCDGFADMYVSSGRFDETVYDDMPWSVMSSDLSTSTGKRLPPVYQDDDTVVPLFRIPDQFVQLPCPQDAWCEAVALSSRGNILLVNSGNHTPFLWTAARGYQNVLALLAADGTALGDLSMTSVDMSDDGRVIIGAVRFTNENGEAVERSARVVLPRRVYEGP